MIFHFDIKEGERHGIGLKRSIIQTLPLNIAKFPRRHIITQIVLFTTWIPRM
jgi:hypothetical protein